MSNNNENDKEKENQEQYYRYPKSFLKDIFITLHSFDNPERDEHEEFIDIEMKYDLFSYAYKGIADIELKFMKSSEEYLKLKSIEKCKETPKYSWMQNIYRNSKIDKEDDMLACEKWVIDINGQREVSYELEFFQSQKDKFYSIVYPPTTMKFFYYMFKNY
ncbi:unnamed protein product [Paramecium primaurelia]|uniref:Uncharacterized protein n=2 Tax=Paramecium TaxID=5884 RepID=A0A8S1TDU5_9CILI|nr:unnamed protein product [Paramecium primaurelia]CAD8149052.1 unnamed protein product [Paramecium pentaurelia]